MTDPSIQKENSSSNFHLAFYFLPKEKRQAMFDFYGFCRYADDIVDELADESRDKAQVALNTLREEVNDSFGGQPKTELGKKIKILQENYPLEKKNFLEIIDGCEMDLSKNRYSTFDDLYLYCYRVASAVGLICKEIFGYAHPSAHDYAVNLGVAFQLTNILRDVREDAQRDRIYLPLEDLEQFGYSPEMLLKGEDNVSFRKLMAFEGDRTLNYYKSAEEKLNVRRPKKLYSRPHYGRCLFQNFAKDSKKSGPCLEEKSKNFKT